MRRPPLLLSLILCVPSFACSGSGSTDPAPSADKPADKQPAKPGADKSPDLAQPDGKPDAGKPDSAQPDDSAEIAAKKAEAKAKIRADKTELAARRSTMVAALNEGRKLVKDGKLDEGIAKYDELLAIDPHYGPALGELGWAEFKAGKLDEAHSHTTRALAEATDDQKRGMLLYNLGRIAEERGQTEVAIGHYKASLGYRPNDTVSARLAGLSPDGTAVPTPPSREPVGLSVIVTDTASSDTLCSAVADASFCTNLECELVAAPAGRDDASVVVVGDGMMNCYHPTIRTPSGWVVFGSALLAQWGSEVHQDIDKITSKIVSNGSGEFLWIEYSDHIYERSWAYGDLEEDDEIPEDDATDSEGVILCSLGAKPACTSAIARRYAYSRGDGSDAVSYSADVDLRGDVLVVSNVQITGDLDINDFHGDYELLAAGEHPLAKLTIPAP